VHAGHGRKGEAGDGIESWESMVSGGDVWQVMLRMRLSARWR
jgi:hypothetical protein